MNNNELLTNIATADSFIKRTYLSELSSYDVIPLDDYQKRFRAIRLYRIDKLVYDKNEDINDKLVSVFNSVQNTRSNLLLILRGNADSVEFYIGVQSNQEIGIADKVFSKSILGNFPGSVLKKMPQPQVEEFLTDITSFEERTENLTCLNVIPANRNTEKFVQGMEKYIDTMRGESYVCLLLAASVSDRECEQRLQGYEQLYSTLYPLSNMSLARGTSVGDTITEGYNNSISHAVSESIAKTTGQNTARTNTTGMHAGFFGLGMNFSHGITSGTSTSESKTTGNTDTKTEGYNRSTTKTNTTTDNVTVNYKDKMIEDSLEHIEHRIKRIKECMTYGMWECAAYFMSDNMQTSVVAANAFRSLMLGEDNRNEKSYLNLFGMRERASTLAAIESLRYCRHPVFRIPTGDEPQLVTATEHLSGKEVPLMFALPRKSVAGVAVTSMAEFGRDVIYVNDVANEDRPSLNIGKITHMNQIESTDVCLDLESLTAHCFITGSTGSGKSNTTFTILNELLKSENKIPFLVIEPAKGEYKFAFSGVPNINIFTTATTTGRFLKINPFKFPKNIHVLEHLDRLIEIFNTCWEMYAAMPAILKDAIERCYEKKGWNLLNSVYSYEGEPQYPTFKDLLSELPLVINQSGYSSDTKGDYVGALVTRVNSLTNGIIGQIFCDCYDIEDSALFDESTIIDLSRVGSSETKSLIMGILVLKLTEHRMANGEANNSNLRHVTIIEEAHNLLKNVKNSPSGTSSVVAKSVEMICNSIAEMRTYGESFILVDQSPSAVDITAIKNTNTKIIMRLPEMGDCEAIGRSVSLNDNQISELSKLRTGVAVVMQNNWSDAVLTKINRYQYQYASDIPVCSTKELMQFKSAVLGKLLDEYAVARTRSVSKILEIIEAFDIDRYKKEDAVRMVKCVSSAMDSKWDSVVFGNALLQYSGAEGIFRRAEQSLSSVPKRGDNGSDDISQGVEQFFDFLSEETSKILVLNEQQRTMLLQYFVYAKSYDEGNVDYDAIYRKRYII